MSRWLPLLACSAALVVFDAHALSPGPPRPAPSGIGTYCSNQPVPADPTEQACGFGNSCDFGAECLATPTSVVSGAAVRGILTVIVDEDVAGFDGGERNVPDDARLTVLLEFTKGGIPFAVSETMKLSRFEQVDLGGGFVVTCDLTDEQPPTTPSLCVKSWTQPATEAFLVDGFNLQWTPLNADLNSAVRKALLTPAQLADPALADARVLLEVVDRDLTVDHQSDALASIARFKVTLRVQP